MKTRILSLLTIAIILIAASSCSSSKGTTGKVKSGKSVAKPKLLSDQVFLITEISTDDSYGYTSQNPINVGGTSESNGPLNERRFLNALAGPNGEAISYSRTSSCCSFKTENGLMGAGLLDKYEVKWEGIDKPITLYINMYDYAPFKAPVGFTIAK